MSYVGAALSPRETKKLVLGRGSYIGDLTVPGLLHAAFVRSPHAHARICRIDVDAGRRQPGVVAVLTGHDLARVTVPLRIAPPIDGLLPMEMSTLPVDRVRFVGDLVACVIGAQRDQVEDAGTLVDVEYAPLPAVVDPERAQDPGLPLVDETIPANRAYAGVFTSGNVAAALGAADRVVAVRFHQGRQTHVPLEPRGCLASWLPGDETLNFWHSTQIPHPLRSALAARLGISESAVRVITPDVGGGFGQKIPLYREELTTAAASRLLGRPVRWIQTRRENLLAALHAREDIVDVQAAVKSDGTVLGLDVQILTDFGAYAYFPANYMARVIGMMVPGAYRLRDYRYTITAVLTNKCPAGPYRAPMLICSWVTEGTIDAIARALELDPIEVRRQNMRTAPQQTHTTGRGARSHAGPEAEAAADRGAPARGADRRSGAGRRLDSRARRAVVGHDDRPARPEGVPRSDRAAAGAGARARGDARVRSTAADLLERDPHLPGRDRSRDGRADDPALHDRRGLRSNAEPAHCRGAASRRRGPGPRRRPPGGDRLRRRRTEPQRDLARLRDPDGRADAIVRDRAPRAARPEHAAGHEGNGRGRCDGRLGGDLQRRRRRAGAARHRRRPPAVHRAAARGSPAGRAALTWTRRTCASPPPSSSLSCSVVG